MQFAGNLRTHLMKLQKLFITSLILGIANLSAKAGESTALIKTDSDDILLGTTVTLSGNYSGKADLKDENNKKSNGKLGSASVTSAGISISQVLPSFWDGYKPIVEIENTNFFIDRKNTTPLPKRMTSASLSLGISKEFDERWSFLGTVAPGISNAGDSLSGDGFGASGALVGSYAFSEAFTLSLGVAGDSLAEGSGLFSGSISPIVGIEWAFAEKWTLSLGFPNTELAYQATPKLKLGLSAGGEGGTFAVQNDPLPKGANKPDLKDSKLSYESTAISIEAEYALTDRLTIEAEVGYIIEQEFEYTLKKKQKWNGNNSEEFKLKSDGGAPYSSVSLSYAF